MRKTIKRIGTFFILILFSNSMYGQYGQLNIESEEDYLERKLSIAKMKRQLNDIENGRTTTDDNNQYNGQKSTFKAEIHQCSNNGYHNTSYEPHCFDMYFYPNGTISWNRRRFAKVRYDDTLSGSYYLVETRKNRYKLYITWANGNKWEGHVEYNGNSPIIHMNDYVFRAK